MAAHVPETFVVDRSFVVLVKVGCALAAAFAVLCLALPFLADSSGQRTEAPSRVPLYVASLLGAGLFGFGGWYCYRIIKRVPFLAVTVDADGVWPAHLPKEKAILRWPEIVDLRERPMGQRLDLVDDDGAVLLRLEYQLAGFERLRALVVERSRKPKRIPALPAIYSKGWIFHVGNLTVACGAAVLGWYTGSTLLLAGTLIVAGLILREYFATVSKVVVGRMLLEVHYPLRSHRYRYDQIESMTLGDSFERGTRLPLVQVGVRGSGKRIKLQGLNGDSVHIYEVLRFAAGRGN